MAKKQKNSSKPKLTRKQKAFADAILDNPSISNTQAVVDAGYKVSNRHTAEVIASENMRKPEIQLYLDKHVEMAKKRIVDLANNASDSVALKASQDILDRNFGKATQKTESKQIKWTIESVLE